MNDVSKKVVVIIRLGLLILLLPNCVSCVKSDSYSGKNTDKFVGETLFDEWRSDCLKLLTRLPNYPNDSFELKDVPSKQELSTTNRELPNAIVYKGLWIPLPQLNFNKIEVDTKLNQIKTTSDLGATLILDMRLSAPVKDIFFHGLFFHGAHDVSEVGSMEGAVLSRKIFKEEVTLTGLAQQSMGISIRDIDCAIDSPSPEDFKKLTLLPYKYYSTKIFPKESDVTSYYKLDGYMPDVILVSNHADKSNMSIWVAKIQNSNLEISWRLVVPSSIGLTDNDILFDFMGPTLPPPESSGEIEANIEEAIEGVAELLRRVHKD